MASVTLRIRLGPLVFFKVEGDNCREVAEKLDGFLDLNKKVDAMFSDLAERVYPEGVEAKPPPAAAAKRKRSTKSTPKKGRRS